MEDKPVKKEMTLEDLAKQMAEGFSKSDERFTKTDERFTKLEKQLAEGFAKSNHQYEELAQMTANGFANVQGQITGIKDDVTGIKNDIIALRTEMGSMETRLKAEIEGLRNSVDNYLKLSDERYLELKHQNEVYAKWFKMLAEKTHTEFDFAELTKL